LFVDIKKLLRRYTYKICKNILLLIVNAIQYIIQRSVPVDNEKVVYLPVNGNLKGNAYYLLNELSRVFVGKHIYICDKGFPVNDNALFVNFGLSAIYHYSTAKYVFRESEFNTIGLLSRKDTVYIQLWHAAGAFKKMALDVEKRSSFIKYMRRKDILSWDLILCSSPYIIDIYSKAFANFDREKIFVSGLPRNDYLYDLVGKKKEICSDYKFPTNKQIVLYAPTFRDKATKYDDDLISSAIEYLAEKLPEGFALGVRLHPSMMKRFNLKDNVLNLNICCVEEAIVISDFLITDYSSIIFDFSLLLKPMFFYTPDFYRYYDKRGFYFDYSEFVPGKIFSEVDNLLHEIVASGHNDTLMKVDAFRKRYNPFFDGNNSKRIIDRIFN